MNPITINQSEVLILKADMMLSKDHLEAIRRDIAEQAESGLVIIPSGFSYEIWKRDYCILQEDKQ